MVNFWPYVTVSPTTLPAWSLLPIELDGDFHTNSEKGAKRTKLRNQYYLYAGIKLISYVTKELDKMTDEELLADLKSKL